MQLAQELQEFLAAGKTATEAAASQLRLLRASARLDDSPEASWDWTITAAAGVAWERYSWVTNQGLKLYFSKLFLAIHHYSPRTS